MKRVLVTGAAGSIGGHLRKLLPPLYPEVVFSDIRSPAGLGADERFEIADITRLEDCERICRGVDGVVHLGGQSTEAPWERILQANIIGQYNMMEAAHRQGVQRFIVATSNHAVGFHPRSRTIDHAVVPLPDSRYGVSKLFAEGLGAMYAMKHGMGVLALRIGNVNEKPIDVRRLAIWLHPEDLVQLIRIGLERPGLVYEVCYGVSDNATSWYDNRRAFELGYRPRHKSEAHRAEAEAADAGRAPDPVGDHYQGGTYCSDEYSTDFAERRAATEGRA
jgi:uronate dehydrogenase